MPTTTDILSSSFETTEFAANKIHATKVDDVARPDSDADTYPIAPVFNSYDANLRAMSRLLHGKESAPTWHVANNSIVSGSLIAVGGMSGSLTRLVDGSSYLVAGDNVTITTGSNGAITISSDDSASDMDWLDEGNLLSTTASLEIGDGSGNTDITVNGGVSSDIALIFQKNGTAYGQFGLDPSENVYISSRTGAGNPTGIFEYDRSDEEWEITANSNLAVSILDAATTFHGLNGGAISGSITRTEDGLSYLVAGANVTITSGSNGQITISSSDFASDNDWLDEGNLLSTTASIEIAASLFMNATTPNLIMGNGGGGSKLIISGTNHGIQWDYQGAKKSDLLYLTSRNAIVLRNASSVEMAEWSLATSALTASADVFLKSASPSLIIGNGSGAPRRIMDKTDASAAYDDWQVAGVRRWLGWYHETDENLKVIRYNSSGILQDTPINIAQSNGSITYSGNATWSSTSPTLTLGTGAGSPNIRMQKADGSATSILFRMGSFDRNIIRSDTSENLVFLSLDASGSLVATTTYDNATGNWDFPANVEVGADVTLDSSSPTLTVGNGNGSTGVRLRKTDAGTANLSFRTGDFDRQILRMDGSENLVFLGLDAAGSLVATTTYDNATGNWAFPADVYLSGSDARLTVGNGSDAGTVRINKGASNTSYIQFAGDADDDTEGDWRINHAGSEAFTLQRYTSTLWTDILLADDTEISLGKSITPGGVGTGNRDLGLDGNRWSRGFIDGIVNGLTGPNASNTTSNHDQVYSINNSAAPRTFTFKNGEPIGKRWEIIVQSSANAVTFDTEASETINGESSIAPDVAGLYIATKETSTEIKLFGPVPLLVAAA